MPAGDGTAEPNDAAAQDEEPEPRALHAKIILAEHFNGRTLWMGSANATTRGWRGPNTEVIAQLEVGPAVASALGGFVEESATTVRPEDLGDPGEPDATDERLEIARKHVASTWNVLQRVEPEGPVLAATVDPNAPDPEVTLCVGLLAGASLPWPRGVTTLRLPKVAPQDVTEFVICCLRLGDAETSWMQRAPLDPPPDDERDRQTLARYMDARTFLSWVRSLLTGETTDDGGGDWDQDAPSTKRQPSRDSDPVWWAPTIEEVLKAWSRDASSLELIDKRLRHYLKLYEEQPDFEQSPADRRGGSSRGAGSPCGSG